MFLGCCSMAVDMLIDVLSDRGFSVAHSAEERLVPERVDLKTGEIESRVELVHKFRWVGRPGGWMGGWVRG